MRARLLDRLPYLANQTTPLFCVRVYLLAFLSSILLQLRWSRIEQALRLSLFPPRSSNLEINVALSCERSPANVAGSPVSLVSFNARGAYRTAKRCLLKRGLRVSQRWRKICGISIRICSCFFLQAQRSSAVMEASKTFVIRAAARVVHSTFWQGLQPPHPEEIGMPKFGEETWANSCLARLVWHVKHSVRRPWPRGPWASQGLSSPATLPSSVPSSVSRFTFGIPELLVFEAFLCAGAWVRWNLQRRRGRTREAIHRGAPLTQYLSQDHKPHFFILGRAAWWYASICSVTPYQIVRG